MMRSFFLYLARTKWARKFLMAMPGSRRVARRFVAGETIDDAVKATRTLNQKGIMVTLDHLGENVYSEADAQRAMQHYLDLLDTIDKTAIRSHVSLKLTQLGLDVGEALCEANMRKILERARKYGNFVRIDMEGSAYTEKTLRIYRALRRDFQNVGVVIQAYLHRSEADMHALAEEGANIRLCKGAYKEPPEIAFPLKSDVDQNYIKLMQIFLSEPARAKGAYIALATHDEKMIQATKAFAASQNVSKDCFEFQMLYGVRPTAQQQLVTEGYKMRVYVPFGTEWYPYFMRRLAERPANVWFLARNFFKA